MEVCPENMTDHPTDGLEVGHRELHLQYEVKEINPENKELRIYGLREKKQGIRDKVSPIFCNTNKKSK